MGLARVPSFSLAIALTLAALLTADEPGHGRAPKANSTYDTFYSPTTVQTIHLRIAKEDLRRLQEALPKRIYVPATFRWKNTTIENVAVRYKGNSSSSPKQPYKRSFLVRFDKYKNSQRFAGLRRISLDNGIQFGSLFSEPIITEILRDLGVPTHRCNYARLELNGKYHGVYVNVERIDQEFVKRHFSDSKGPLYKVHLGGPGGNLQYVGDDTEPYSRTFEAKSKSAAEELRKLVDFIKMINQSPSQGFVQRLESELYLNDFLQTTAVMLFSGAFDQLTGWNPHNYYLYRDGPRWRYMAWDLDVGFSATAFGRIQVLNDWNAAWPAAGGPPKPILERIIKDPELLKRYRASAGMILEKYFKPERMNRILDAKYALIKKDLANDPFPSKRVTNPRDNGYDSIVASMKSFFQKRYDTARAQLETPGKRPRIVRRPRQQPPRPGPASKDSPSQLVVASRTARSVRLKWKDNARDEIAYIVQRADGKAGGTFRNHIGRPGDDVVQVVDRGARAGRTYRYRVYAVRRTPQGPKGTGVSNVVTVMVAGEN